MAKKYGFCLDKTTDSLRRNVAKIIISILQPQDDGKTYSDRIFRQGEP